MWAGVVHGREDIRYEEVETPSYGDDDVLVRVKYTGICGSDIPRVNGDAAHFVPIILGHEFSGTVEETGKNVDEFKKGDRVAGIPLLPCMECDDCKKGNFSLCKHYNFIGSRRNGSFAQYISVPRTNLVKFDDNVSFEQGALFEPSTVALHGLECADYKGGHTVAVLGTGNIGLLTMQWAKIFGASNVTCVNRSREKLQLATELGADCTVSTLDEDYRDQLMAITGGKGFDYVYVTTASNDMIKESFKIAANKAHICCIGTPKVPISFTVDEWELINRREFYLTGSWMSYSAPFPGHEWTHTAHYFATGQLKYDRRMIDRIIPLEHIDEAFELFKQPGAVKGKILIESC
ncbi:MAG: galactitol-1-phosphate 5-dehydrogenase [Eubacterium sp.]|nr:galactitol-1-phosphate 5-dehydrogenase [Eubacterium sp.]